MTTIKPDVVWRTLEIAMAACPTLTCDIARRVELQARAEFGGVRVDVPKTPYRPDRGYGRTVIPEAKARAVIADVVSRPDVSTDVLVKRHGVSRATIYRLMKRWPG